MGADAIIALVRSVSPTVADLISQGPGPLIKNAITSAVQSFLGSIGLGGADLGSAWSTITTAFSADTIAGLFANKGGSCEAFIAGIDALRDLGSRFMNSPAVKGVEAFFSTVNDIVTKIGTFVFAPAFDVLKSILGSAWDAITAVGKTIWDGLQAIKDAAGQAFDWVAQKLGFSSATGEDGLTDWISKKASDIWESIKSTIQPIIGPLKIVGGAIAMLTGVGELYLIIKYAPKVVQAVQWLWAHKNDPDIVKSAHEQMGDTILPQLLEAGQGIASTLETAFSGFLAKLTALGTGLLELVGAVTGVPLLSMVQGFIQTVSSGVQRAIAWASEFVSSAVAAVKSGAQKLYAFVKPYIPVLMSLAAAITNPAMIPVILAGWAWLALPDCVKPPIIDLLLDAVISVLSKTPDLALLGLLWPIVKAGVLGFLQKVRALKPEEKITVTNKLATIMTGSSPKFLLGFAVGLLKGIWTLVSQPFELVWQMASGIVKLADWLGGTVEDFFTPAKDKKKAPAAGAATKPGAAGTGAAKPPAAATPTPQGASTPDTDAHGGAQDDGRRRRRRPRCHRCEGQARRRARGDEARRGAPGRAQARLRGGGERRRGGRDARQRAGRRGRRRRDVEGTPRERAARHRCGGARTGDGQPIEHRAARRHRRRRFGEHGRERSSRRCAHSTADPDRQAAGGRSRSDSPKHAGAASRRQGRRGRQGRQDGRAAQAARPEGGERLHARRRAVLPRRRQEHDPRRSRRLPRQDLELGARRGQERGREDRRDGDQAVPR